MQLLSIANYTIKGKKVQKIRQVVHQTKERNGVDYLPYIYIIAHQNKNKRFYKQKNKIIATSTKKRKCVVNYLTA